MGGKLTIHREAHKRKPYKRKSGVKVKGAEVKGSTFEIKDRGKPGRTPKSERFFHPKVHTGWEAGMPAEKRRRLVKKAHEGDLLASGRSMVALANVQHRINPDVAQKARADADYFFRELARRKKKKR
jgi:hypothetical protein